MWAQPALSGELSDVRRHKSDTRSLEPSSQTSHRSQSEGCSREGSSLPKPFEWADRSWLKNGRPRRPQFNYEKNCWEIPAAWFNDTVERCLDHYSQVYVIQPYRVQEKCAPACQNAKGHVCQCSCMGQNHGMANDGSWFEVSDTFATRWGDEHMASRLLTRT